MSAAVPAIGGINTARVAWTKLTESMKEASDLPTAKQALATVKMGEYAKAANQMKEIVTLINEKIAAGGFSISGDGDLELPVKEALSGKGYKVDSGYQKNESYWSVSWANPT